MSAICVADIDRISGGSLVSRITVYMEFKFVRGVGRNSASRTGRNLNRGRGRFSESLAMDKCKGNG
jgi:hypothetical protein